MNRLAHVVEAADTIRSSRHSHSNILEIIECLGEYVDGLGSVMVQVLKHL